MPNISHCWPAFHRGVHDTSRYSYGVQCSRNDLSLVCKAFHRMVCAAQRSLTLHYDDPQDGTEEERLSRGWGPSLEDPVGI